MRPFDIHSSGHGRLRQAGMDAAGWTVWFETVVNRDVEDEERLRLGMDLPPALFYESDPPTIAEQLQMKEAVRAKTPPALWKGSVQVGELLDDLWVDFSSQPVQRRNRFPGPPRDGEQPGSPEQHSELYGSMRELGPGLPSLHCYPVAYPAPGPRGRSDGLGSDFSEAVDLGAIPRCAAYWGGEPRWKDATRSLVAADTLKTPKAISN